MIRKKKKVLKIGFFEREEEGRRRVSGVTKNVSKYLIMNFVRSHARVDIVKSVNLDFEWSSFNLFFI